MSGTADEEVFRAQSPTVPLPGPTRWPRPVHRSHLSARSRREKEVCANPVRSATPVRWRSRAQALRAYAFAQLSKMPRAALYAYVNAALPEARLLHPLRALHMMRRARGHAGSLVDDRAGLARRPSRRSRD